MPGDEFDLIAEFWISCVFKNPTVQEFARKGKKKRFPANNGSIIKKEHMTIFCGEMKTRIFVLENSSSQDTNDTV